MFTRRSQFVGFLCMLNDLVLTTLAFVLAYVVRSSLPYVLPQLGPLFSIDEYWLLLGGILMLWVVLGYATGIYRQIDPRDNVRLAGSAVVLVLLGSIATLAALYLVKGEYISRSFVLLFGVIDAALLPLGRLGFFAAMGWVRERMQRYRYFLVVGTGAAARELVRHLEHGGVLGYRVVGFVETSSPAPDDLRRDHHVFSLAQMPELLSEQVVDEVLFAADRDELPRLESLIVRCQQEGVHTRVHLDFLPRHFSSVYLENLGDVPLLTFANTPVDELLLFAKRTADILGSTTLLLLLAPVMGLTAALVWATSSGPVLYRQTRCGLAGRRFTLLKFRSMVDNAEQLRQGLEAMNELGGPVFKMANDPRVTLAGRFLRKFSLDELPQLWNILRGDMSFVGPRPPLPEEVSRYEGWQRRRLRMRPGLTCLWAIEGRNDVPFERWMQLDLAYIDNWSLWLDVKIFLKTIPIALRGRGAY
jgi:exopolysaccharide biosynthesis polyprenyl glycosylphosphotransferase